MTLQQLIYFREVADTRNFTKASKNLNVTQSALSYSIISLERELELPLFIRSCGRKIELTSYGSVLLPMAAQAATWTGGADGYIDVPGNWSGDVTATEMLFTSDAYLRLNKDYSVFRVFGTSGNSHYITIDLSGHNLGTTSTESSSRDFWRANNTTICITNSSDTSATFAQASNIVLDHSSYHDTTLVIAGAKTTMNGTFFSKGGPRFSFNVLDGATLSGAKIGIGSNFSTNTVANGATLSAATYLNVGAGSELKPHGADTGAWHDNLLTVSDATISGGSLLVGHGQLSNTGAPYNNTIIAEDGARVSFNSVIVGCGAAATNNSIRATGSGTTLTVATTMKVGTRTGAADGTLHATLPATNNMVIVENGATANVKTSYIGAGGNALVVRSGATFEGTSGGTVQLLSDMTDEMITTAGGAIGSRIEVVGGTLHFLNDMRIGTQYATNHVYGHEVFIGAGGTLSEKQIIFYGVGDRLVVSNGTVTVSGLNMGSYGGNNNTVRIIGESASIKTGSLACNGRPAIFEFATPETPWTEAPFRVTDNFTIPADFILRLDEAALKACRKRMIAQGVSRVTMPLMQAKTDAGAAKNITISDMAALSANLPEGCSLSYANGVLSLKVNAGKGLTIFVR